MRARMRSIAAPTKDQRSVLMAGIENAGSEIHPGTLRFGSRLIAGFDAIATQRDGRYRHGI